MKFLLAFASVVALAVAQTVYDIPNSDDCNGYSFSNDDLSNASYQALYDLNDGTTQGSDNYPHQYNDYENIDFPSCSSPYYEYPVFQGSTYNGGSPGADRVVIGSYDGTNANFCGVITHNGASSRNGFVGCQEE